MHVNSDRDPFEIKGRDNVLSVGGIFLYRKLIHVEGNISLRDCAVISEFGELCERWIHTGGSQRTQEKLRKEIGGLESRGEGLWETFDCPWAEKVLQREHDSFWAYSFCNTGYISTCMTI